MDTNKKHEVALVLLLKNSKHGISKICQILDKNGVTLWTRNDGKTSNDREIPEKELFKFLAKDDLLELSLGVDCTVYISKEYITKLKLVNSKSLWYSGRMLAFGRSVLKHWPLYRLDAKYTYARLDWDSGREGSVMKILKDTIEDYITKNNLINNSDIASWWLEFTLSE